VKLTIAFEAIHRYSLKVDTSLSIALGSLVMDWKMILPREQTKDCYWVDGIASGSLVEFASITPI
jgi:hypothetical protein